MYIFLHSVTQFRSVCACHDPLSHLAIMHEGADESLRKICKYQHNVPQHYYLFDTPVS